MRKNSEKDWNDWHEGAINETSRSDVGASSPALDIRTCKGGPVMPDYLGNIGSDESASNTSKDNWQSIGELAAKLVRK
jgi:hypothetical protein